MIRLGLGDVYDTSLSPSFGSTIETGLGRGEYKENPPSSTRTQV